MFGERGRSGTPMEQRTLTCLVQGGCSPPVSGGLFNIKFYATVNIIII